MSTLEPTIHKVLISTSSREIEVTVRRGETTAFPLDVADALGIWGPGKRWSVRQTPDEGLHWHFDEAPIFLRVDDFSIAHPETMKFNSPKEGNTLAATAWAKLFPDEVPEIIVSEGAQWTEELNAERFRMIKRKYEDPGGLDVKEAQRLEELQRQQAEWLRQHSSLDTSRAENVLAELRALSHDEKK